MTKQEYNGWYNYETWVVNLWMDNEKGSQDFWMEEARLCLEQAVADAPFTKEDRARLAFAELLQEQHEEALPELEGFAADLLGAAMSEVNWHEIARQYIDAAKEEEEQTEGSENTTE